MATVNTVNHEGIDDQFLTEIHTYRASSRDMPFDVREEHLFARDSCGRSCLHVALLKTRNYKDYAGSLEIFSYPHPPNTLGWPSLNELENKLLGPRSQAESWEGLNFRRVQVPNIPLNFDLVKQLVAAGANVHSVDSEGNYCLHYAVENEDCCDLIPVLLQAGAKLESSNKYGDTALLTAVKVNNLKAVETLIKYGADINVLNYDEDTCLHLAGNNVMFNFLLNAGCTVPMNCMNQCGCTPFLAAVDYCDVTTLMRMIQAGADVDFQHRKCGPYVCRRWNNSLSMAICRNRDDIVEILLKYGANPNKFAREDETILCLASRMLCSVDSSIDPNPTEDEKIANILQLLITHGTNVRNISVESFRNGIRCGNLRVVHLFLDKIYRQGVLHSSDVDAKPLLHLALCNKRDDVFKFILESNLHDLDKTDFEGYSAFHRCVAHTENQSRAKILIDYGADISTKNNRGKTVLHTAFGSAFGPHGVKWVAFLLSYGSLPSWRLRIAYLSMEIFEPRTCQMHPESIEKIVTHVALIDSLGHFIEPRILNRILTCIDSNQELYERCKIEIGLLRKSFFQDLISFYDVLTRVDHRFVRNKDLVEKIVNEDLHKRFPIYEDLIRRRIAESQQALELILGSVKSLNRILKIDYQTFYQVYENILCRLRKIDLLNLQRI
ncbi:hypothetical protein QAD02_016219 [Eretmocerus hayati]|uniref:Uncharacterized protein n=1 Tax=Eretmocerus hayati TaxID=131215 RepID=A0ACC2PAG2_9HYME|nr:hypothetical protein QAD02_016219 [Eretmocerus hayati]